jgi:hypothetical protein|tara:strand:- start:225 stop:719 length:495 start_codon:yes stop_codon:yes gene_type:complete
MAVTIKPKPTNPDTLARIQRNHRINILERGEELVAEDEITQKQLDESLKIFDETKSMEAVNQYMKEQETKRSIARIKVKPPKKVNRIKVKPMGKATGGQIKGSPIKMNDGGKVKGKGSMLSITIEQKPINKKTMNMIKQAEKAGNVVKMKSGGAARRGYGKARR